MSGARNNNSSAKAAGRDCEAPLNNRFCPLLSEDERWGRNDSKAHEKTPLSRVKLGFTVSWIRTVNSYGNVLALL